MDPKKLLIDERLSAYCVYCGGIPTTNDHAPSKVLLDEPFPDNLPGVGACGKCNTGFSLDEEYLACLIECVICGSADFTSVHREKVQRILTERPAIAARIAASRREGEGGKILWEPEATRVQNVVLKLARGHAA